LTDREAGWQTASLREVVMGLTASEREARHTESGRYTTEDWLHIYAAHLEGHATQIERNVEAWNATKR
jgi:hypothetical protein